MNESIQIKHLSKQIRACTKCALCETRSSVVVGRGSMNPIVLFIGESPGWEENKTGIPFIGSSGNIFDGDDNPDSWIKFIGLEKPRDYAVINCLKCWPKNTSGSGGRNRPPTKEEIDTCRPWLDKQVELLAPKIIVTIGKYATVAFLGGGYESGITSYCGKLYNDEEYGNGSHLVAGIYPIVHPSWFLRNRGEDPYEQLERLKELVREIKRKKQPKKEIKEQGFVHLHAHTTYSFLDGYGTPDKIADRYKEMGFKSAAITDHGTIAGILKFSKACKERDIKPIIGCEFYAVIDNQDYKKIKEGKVDKEDLKYEPKTRFHMTVLAKNKYGYENLLKLVTDSNLSGFYYKPRTDYQKVYEHRKGLIIFSGCIISRSSRLIRDGEIKAAQRLLEKQAKMYDDFYLEIMPHQIDEQIQVNEFLFDFAKGSGIKMVATNDTHYIDSEDAETQEVMMAIGTNKKMSDKDRMCFDENSSFHIRSREEMLEEFRKIHGGKFLNQIEEAMNNTVSIAGSCNVDIKTSKDLLPVFDVPTGYSSESYFGTLCNKGFRSRKIPKTKEYVERFEYEKKIIKDKNFINYFLIVWDLIHFAKSNNIGCGPARGSSAGSLISYCLGITEIDPIKYGLYFERFISPNRKDLPDVDMDFEDKKRGVLKEYLSNKYGNANVATIGTFGKFAGRGALKDAARVYEVSLSETQKIANFITEKIDKNISSIEEAISDFVEVKNYAIKYPKVVEQAKKLEGNIRNGGIHAAGMIISRSALNKFVSLEKRKGQQIASFDGEDCKYIGFLKLDIFGLRTVSIIQDTFNLIKKDKNIDLSFNNIPMNDQRVFEEMSNGNCSCIFQFSTAHLSKLCLDFGVEDFMEMSHINACSRPGVMQSGATIQRLKIKRKEQKQLFFNDDKLDKYYRELTKDTLVILYQEQVMQVVREVGCFDWDETNYIREAISKSKGEKYFNKLKKKFIENSVKNFGANKEASLKFWNTLYTFGAWGYNLAHSVSYSMISYVCAWLKINYSIEYLLCCLLNESKDEIIFDILSEVQRRGFKFKKPDVKFSEANFSIQDGVIYGGLSKIKYVGNKAAENIMLKKPYSDINDFLLRLKGRECNKRALESLAKAGALNSFGIDRGVFLKNIEQIVKSRTVDGIKMVLRGRGPESIGREEMYFIENDVVHFPIEFDLFDCYQNLIDMVDIPLMSTNTLDYKNSVKRVLMLGFIQNFKMKTTLCMIGFRFSDISLGLKQCSISLQLYRQIDNWISDAVNKKYPIIAIGSKVENSPFINVRMMACIKDLKKEFENGKVYNNQGRFLMNSISKLDNSEGKWKQFDKRDWKTNQINDAWKRDVDVQLVGIREHVTKGKGRLMAFCEFEDSLEVMDVAIFPNDYAMIKDTLKVGNVYKCKLNTNKKIQEDMADGRPTTRRQNYSLMNDRNKTNRDSFSPYIKDVTEKYFGKINEITTLHT